ncbi:hypothetical protein TNCV_2773951 [Trichonephila clavipes]|nr:hypothetical protein TNCV_2773951 [Trichonephila clavipes]
MPRESHQASFDQVSEFDEGKMSGLSSRRPLLHLPFDESHRHFHVDDQWTTAQRAFRNHCGKKHQTTRTFYDGIINLGKLVAFVKKKRSGWTNVSEEALERWKLFMGLAENIPFIDGIKLIEVDEDSAYDNGTLNILREFPVLFT